jgi:hypothetical protein
MCRVLLGNGTISKSEEQKMFNLTHSEFVSSYQSYRHLVGESGWPDLATKWIFLEERACKREL